jgi:hypothetical protein
VLLAGGLEPLSADKSMLEQKCACTLLPAQLGARELNERACSMQGVGDAEVAAAGYAQLHEGVSPTTAMAVSPLEHHTHL